MLPDLHSSRPVLILRILLLIGGLCCGLLQAGAQSFVNGDFELGSAGWDGCPFEINPANVYGGPNTSRVAEVDGHNDPLITADDRVLCQTVAGFTVGALYALEFDATRRQTGPTPASVSVTVVIDNVLEHIVTRTGAWNMQREHLVFTATSTSHSMLITPNFTGSHGMIFDNFAYVLVSPLPVELLYFDARPSGPEVILDWATATERDNAGFIVERSRDLGQWEEVLQVPGNGHSLSTLVYQARDPRPLHGTSFYRLKQVDFDGSVTHSHVRAVEWKAKASLHVWPNPASSVLHVHAGELVRVQVFNAMGQEMHVAQQGTDHGALVQMDNLPPGSYHLRVLGAMGGAVRFIKE